MKTLYRLEIQWDPGEWVTAVYPTPRFEEIVMWKNHYLNDEDCKVRIIKILEEEMHDA